MPLAGRRVKISDDRGSALLDFLGFGLLLQIPVLVLASQLATMQSNQLAADSIARHSLRSFALYGTEVAVTSQEIAEDLELKVSPAVELLCSPDCTGSGSILRINVTFEGINSSSVMIR